MNLEHKVIGMVFETNGTLEHLNKQLGKYGLVADVFSPNDRPHYAVRRLSEPKGKDRYELIHNNPIYEPAGKGSHSLRTVAVGEVLCRGSAIKSDFYVGSQSVEHILGCIERVREDFPKPCLIDIERKDQREGE